MAFWLFVGAPKRDPETVPLVNTRGHVNPSGLSESLLLTDSENESLSEVPLRKDICSKLKFVPASSFSTACFSSDLAQATSWAGRMGLQENKTVGTLLHIVVLVSI